MKKLVIILILFIFPIISSQEVTWILGDSLSLNFDEKGYPPKLDKLMNSNSSLYNLAQ
ncbi:MAG: hypothetical protein ABIB79_00080 [archaeon]